MPVIKPRTRGKQLVKHRTRLDRENNETLYAYAQFLGESTEYVLNQVIDTVLARDKEFVTWRDDHPDSFVPRQQDRRRPDERRTVGGLSASARRPARQHAVDRRPEALMLRTIVEARELVALGVAGGVGVWGLSRVPVLDTTTRSSG